VAHLPNLLAVEAHDHVTGLDRAVLDGAALDDAGDQRAARAVHAQAFGNVVCNRLDAHAEPTAAGLAELAQLLDDPDGELRRDREADADRAARRRDDR